MSIEHPGNIYSRLVQSTDFFLLPAVFGGGCLAFAMVLFEFQLVSHTSVLTLSIAGIFKEVITIGASMAIFGDKLESRSIVGLIISLSGIFMFHQMRRNHFQTISPKKENNDIELVEFETLLADIEHIDGVDNWGDLIP
jgi:drug/metabolite transporter (DMT)-like permease